MKVLRQIRKYRKKTELLNYLIAIDDKIEKNIKEKKNYYFSNK